MLLAAIILSTVFTYLLVVLGTYWLGHYISARNDLVARNSAWGNIYDINYNEPFAWVISTFWVVTWPVMGFCYGVKYLFKKLTGGGSLRSKAIAAGRRK